MKRHLPILGAGAVAFSMLASQAAMAANILFVSDETQSQGIATVLSGAGHSVTTVLNDYDGASTNNTVLQGGTLGAYDAIFWVASGEGSGDVHAAATMSNLSSYVSAGGHIYITGYDSVASPADAELIAFVGFTSSDDTSGENINGPLTGTNSLTTGTTDITGLSPTGGYSDSDTLIGPLAGTTCISVRPSGADGAGNCGWSLRTLGSGEIAYVSNGESGASGSHASWEDTTAGDAGAYNASLKNFAGGGVAPGPGPGPSPSAVRVPAVPFWGLGLLGIALTFIARRKIRA